MEQILKHHFSTVKHHLLELEKDGCDHPAMLDDNELAGRLVLAMQGPPPIKSITVARACGVTAQAVNGWRKTGKIDRKHFPALSLLTGKPLAYWLGDDGEPPRDRVVRVHAYDVEGVDADEDFDPSREVWVEGVEVEVSGGPGRIVPEFVPTQYRQRYSLSWFRAKGSDPLKVKLMRVHGESMEKTINDGDVIAVDTGNTRLASNHCFVVIIGDEARVKRLFRSADGRIRIVSDNPDKTLYPDEFVEDDSAHFLIVGRVIERKGDKGL
jgi:phage repressor protein C with HTH and peptisase S24 domain